MRSTTATQLFLWQTQPLVEKRILSNVFLGREATQLIEEREGVRDAQLAVCAVDIFLFWVNNGMLCTVRVFFDVFPS